MTDINEIIGRAMLTLHGKGYADNKGTIDPAFVIDRYSGPGTFLIRACSTYEDIGAAVVKALGEGGYVVGPKTSIVGKIKKLRDSYADRTDKGHGHVDVGTAIKRLDDILAGQDPEELRGSTF